jgi:pimeloyl-ACP methyl ester carboxylesterase
MATIRERTLSANGLDFGILECGDGPLALCAHGFPDTAHSWRHLLPALADAGYHAVAHFQRGYAPTSVASSGYYQTAALATDANALHDALGGGSDAVLIGHDWGAPAVYGAASTAPERWAKVVGMAVPPGPALGMAFIGNLAQLKRSWYMFFFQSPLADLVVPGNDLAFIDMLWDDWSPGFDGKADAARVKASLADPANLSAALGYYRATLGDGPKDPSLDAVQAATQQVPAQPTLYLHGRQDGCIGVEVAELCASMLPPHARAEIVDGAGHFLQVERPDVVNQLVLDFLGGAGA